MFANAIHIDCWEGVSDIGPETALSSLDEVDIAVRKLDGNRHTLVTVRGPGVAHAAAGGGSDFLLVYVTIDNVVFFTLTNPHASASELRVVNAGGQPGEFPARHLVNKLAAIEALRWFAANGGAHPDLCWTSS